MRKFSEAGPGQPELGRRVGGSARGYGRRWVRVLALSALVAGSGTIGCGGCDDENEGDFRTGDTFELLVEPEALSYSLATPDNPETQFLTLINQGSGDLSSFRFTITQAREVFAFTPPQVTTLKAGAVTEMSVTYTPVDETADSGTLTIETSGNIRKDVPLNTSATNRQLQCNPTPIDFGAVRIGDSQTVMVMVENVGFLDTTLTAASLEFGLDVEITSPPTTPITLAPEEATPMEVTFSPTAGGVIDDRVRLTIEEGSEVFTCELRGSTPLAEMEISPATIDFGAVPVGETVTETLTVRSAGSAELTFMGAEMLFGSSEDFEILDSPADDVIMPVGDALEITVAYTAGETTATGTAGFFSDGITTAQVGIPLIGRPSRPEIGVSPEAVDFGQVGQGFTTTRVLTIFNNGTQDLDVTSMAISGTPEFAIRADAAFPPTTGGSAIIGPGDAVDVIVEYGPTDLGTDQGQLVIESNDPTTPSLAVPLQGIGLDEANCEITANPLRKANFGLVTRGSNRLFPVLVRNTGSGPCRYQGASAMGFNNQSFSFSAASRGVGQDLLPGEEMIVEVNYHPTVINFANNGGLTMMFEDGISGDPMACGMGEFCATNPGHFDCLIPTFSLPPGEWAECSLLLEGFSGISDIAVIPGAVDFGLVTLGCASQATTVTIYNTGTADLQIQDVYLDPTCSDEFELRAVPPLPASVQASNPLPIQVVYRPADLGQDACNLVIESDASESAPILRVPLSGEGTNFSNQIDVFEQISGRKVDVLFAIDGSGSMSEEQSNVAGELAGFLGTAELLNNEYQIGVVHLDLGETKEYGGVDYEAGELIGDPPFLTPTNVPNVLSEFAARVELGASGGTQEAGLEASRLALSDPFITDTGLPCSGGCEEPYTTCSLGNTCGGSNVDFIRDDASLEIVILSDEEDQSTATPDFYVDFFQSIHGFRNNALIHVSVIVGADASGNPATCSSGNGDADAGQRYHAVASQTNGTTGSICASSFASFLQNIGNRAFGLRVEFFLSRAAEPATVEVRVDGNPVATGWTFDPDTNSVVFDQTSVPQPGQIIEIEYDAACFQ